MNFLHDGHLRRLGSSFIETGLDGSPDESSRAILSEVLGDTWLTAELATRFWGAPF